MSFLRSFSADDTLVADFVDGSDESFELLIGRHATSLFNTAYYITGNLDAAERILLDLYCEAYREIPLAQERTTVKFWFYRKLVNQVIAEAEEYDEVKALLSVLGEKSVEKVAERGITREAILQGLEALPVEYRVVFVLRDIMQFDKGEVAEIVERDETAVSAILHRARLMLLRTLDTIQPNEDLDELPLSLQTHALVERLIA